MQIIDRGFNFSTLFQLTEAPSSYKFFYRPRIRVKSVCSCLDYVLLHIAYSH
jgi:hypothetical protein